LRRLVMGYPADGAEFASGPAVNRTGVLSRENLLVDPFELAAEIEPK